MAAAMIPVSVAFADGEKDAETAPTAAAATTTAPTESPAPTEAPASTEAPAPTESPAPTEAPAPTESPAPTETPVPTETPAPVQANVTSIVLEPDEKYPFQTEQFGSVSKTYVSLRQCAELFNASIEWQQADKSVHIVKGDKYLRLVIGQPTFEVYDFDFKGKLNIKKGTKYSLASDEEKAMLTADGLTGEEITPILTDVNGGATYLPIRAVAEALFGAAAPNGTQTVAWADGVTTFNIAEDMTAAGAWDGYLAIRFSDGTISVPEISAEPEEKPESKTEDKTPADNEQGNPNETPAVQKDETKQGETETKNDDKAGEQKGDEQQGDEADDKTNNGTGDSGAAAKDNVNDGTDGGEPEK